MLPALRKIETGCAVRFAAEQRQPSKKGTKTSCGTEESDDISPKMLFRQDIICIDVAHIQSLLLADPIQTPSRSVKSI